MRKAAHERKNVRMRERSSLNACTAVSRTLLVLRLRPEGFNIRRSIDPNVIVHLNKHLHNPTT